MNQLYRRLLAGLSKLLCHLAAGDMQPSYTQKRTVKRILIRCGSYGYSANFHALRLCSHLRFCVRNGYEPSCDAKQINLCLVHRL